MDNLKLKLIEENNTYQDYEIYQDTTKIGILQLVNDPNQQHIFGRQIHIYDAYQRQGLGLKTIELVLRRFNKPFRFCIATNSEKAVNFWGKYLNTTKHKKENIRGEIWQLSIH